MVCRLGQDWLFVIAVGLISLQIKPTSYVEKKESTFSPFLSNIYHCIACTERSADRSRVLLRMITWQEELPKLIWLSQYSTAQATTFVCLCRLSIHCCRAPSYITETVTPTACSQLTIMTVGRPAAVSDMYITTNATQIRLTRFFRTLRTSCLEPSATIAAINL